MFDIGQLLQSAETMIFYLELTVLIIIKLFNVLCFNLFSQITICNDT